MVTAVKEKAWSGLKSELRNIGVAEEKIDTVLQWMNGEIATLDVVLKGSERPWRVKALVRQEMKKRGAGSYLGIIDVYTDKGGKVHLHASSAFPLKVAGILPYKVRKKKDDLMDEMTALGVPIEARAIVSDLLTRNITNLAISTTDKDAAYMIGGYLKSKGVLTTKVEKKGSIYEITASVQPIEEAPEYEGRKMPEKYKKFSKNIQGSYVTADGKKLDVGAEKDPYWESFIEEQEKRENEKDNKLMDANEKILGYPKTYGDYEISEIKDTEIESEIAGYANAYELFQKGSFADHSMALYWVYMMRMGKYMGGKMPDFFDAQIFGEAGEEAGLDLKAANPQFSRNDVAAMGAFMYTVYAGISEKAEKEGLKLPQVISDNVEAAKKGKKAKWGKYAGEAYGLVGNYYGKDIDNMIEDLPLEVKYGLEYAAKELAGFLEMHYFKAHGVPKTKKDRQKVYLACLHASKVILLSNIHAEAGNPDMWMTGYQVPPGTYKYGKEKLEVKEWKQFRVGQGLLTRVVAGEGGKKIKKAYVVWPGTDEKHVMAIGHLVRDSSSPTGYKVKMYVDKDGNLKPKKLAIKPKDSLGYSQVTPKFTTPKDPITGLPSGGSLPVLKFTKTNTMDLVGEKEPVPQFEEAKHSLAVEEPTYLKGDPLNDGKVIISGMKLKGKKMPPAEFMAHTDTELEYVILRQPDPKEEVYYTLITPEIEAEHGGQYDLDPKSKGYVAHTSRLEEAEISVEGKKKKVPVVLMYQDVNTGKFVDALWGHENKGEPNIVELIVGYYTTTEKKVGKETTTHVEILNEGPMVDLVDKETGKVVLDEAGNPVQVEKFEGMILTTVSGEELLKRKSTQVDEKEGTVTVRAPASEQCRAIEAGTFRGLDINFKDEEINISASVSNPFVEVGTMEPAEEINVGTYQEMYTLTPKGWYLDGQHVMFKSLAETWGL